MRRGILLVISGPSGVGKTTLIERLLSEFPSITRSISCTTRPIRENEVDGKDYHFITPTTFNELKDKGMLLEWAEIHGHLYGTPISDKRIDDLISHGKDVLFCLNVAGTAHMLYRVFHPDALIFIAPPSVEELEIRLRKRGQDSESAIKQRLDAATNEMLAITSYDAVIVNDDLEKAYDQLRAVYISRTLNPRIDAHFISKYQARKLEVCGE